MGKQVNGYDVTANKDSGDPGWHYDIRRGDEVVEKSDPEFRDYAKAMKAGTIHATELEPVSGD